MRKKIMLATAVILLAGCSKLTIDSYQQLETGMSYQEVTKHIGKADSCQETLGTQQCIWGNDSKHIKAIFIADKATLFSHKGLN